MGIVANGPSRNAVSPGSGAVPAVSQPELLPGLDPRRVRTHRVGDAVAASVGGEVVPVVGFDRPLAVAGVDELELLPGQLLRGIGVERVAGEAAPADGGQP